MKIDPIKLANSKETLTGELQLATFKRLLAATRPEKELVSLQTDLVNYKVSSKIDAEGRCILVGEVSAELPLLCNRCMQTYLQLVQAEFSLYPVDAKRDISSMAKELDIVFMHQDLVSLDALLEDELLLNLPQITKHAENDPNCVIIRSEFSPLDGETEADSAAKRPNPFSQLNTKK